MPSSSRPYQSKILRFVLQQWQQGLDRQDRAWRQLQSNATWGAQVVMFPIYAMLRAVERANFALGSEHRTQANNAQFTKSPSDSSLEGKSPSADLSDRISAAADSFTGIDRSIATILAHTEELLSSDQKEQLNLAPAPEQPKQLGQGKRSWLTTLWERLWPQQRTNTAANSLGSEQSSEIAKPSAQPGQIITSRVGKLTTSRAGKLTTQRPDAAAGQLTTSRTGKLTTSSTGKLTTQHPSQSAGELTTSPADGNTISRRAAPGLLQNGHTLASMIENRHLVLVRSGNEVSDIFTLEQQRELKSYIFRIITAYWQSRAGATRIPRRLSAKTLLAFGKVSLTALPMELRKAWSQLPSGPQPVSLPPVEPSPVPRSRIFLPRSLSAAATPPMGGRQPLPSRSPYAIHADVNETQYLEHPLEKILRWLDRILSWCERLWHKLMTGRAKMK